MVKLNVIPFPSARDKLDMKNDLLYYEKYAIKRLKSSPLCIENFADKELEPSKDLNCGSKKYIMESPPPCPRPHSPPSPPPPPPPPPQNFHKVHIYLLEFTVCI